MQQGITQPHLAKVKAKRLKIGDARAIRAHARDGKEARLDAHQRKVHWKKKKHDVFSPIHVVFSLKTVGYNLNVERLSKSCLNALGLPNRTLHRQPISTLPDPLPPTKWI